MLCYLGIVILGYASGEIKSKKFQIKTKSHALRKFFASTLENAGMPKNKVDFMIGHTPNGNDLAYFQTDVTALKQLYIKYLPYITFEKTIEVKSLDTRDAKKLEQLSKEYASVKNELESMKADMEDIINKMIEDRVRTILKKD